MNRRDVLTGAGAAVALPGASNALAPPQGPSPAFLALLEAYEREVAQFKAAWDALPDGATRADEEAVFKAQDAIEAEIQGLAPTCIADFAVKAIVAHNRGLNSYLPWKSEPFWIEARALIGRPDMEGVE